MACFVNVPRRGGVKGQITTDHDLNLGVVGPRAFANSRTYQIYTPENARLSIGFSAQVRMESVAIDNVTPQELYEIHLNYASGALVELYRQARHLVILKNKALLLRERKRQQWKKM